MYVFERGYLKRKTTGNKPYRYPLEKISMIGYLIKQIITNAYGCAYTFERYQQGIFTIERFSPFKNVFLYQEAGMPSPLPCLF
jgi:hypothetical protein